MSSKDKKIIYVDLDDTMVHFTEAYIEQKLANPHVPFPQSMPGYFVNLKPIAGAIEAFNQLLKSPILDPYILTAPSELNPLSYTEKRLWVGNAFGVEHTSRLIISAHKHLSKGDFLVDDKTDGKGQRLFEGELINFGSERFPDWASVIEYLTIKVPGAFYTH